jgi:hypothetical protein
MNNPSMLISYLGPQPPECPKCGNQDMNKMAARAAKNPKTGMYQTVPGTECMACGFFEEPKK